MSRSLARSAAPDPVADVGRALRWPAVLEEDLTVGVSEHDAGLVPHGVDGLPGPLLADLELDAVQVDIAVGLDLHLPTALTPNAGRRGDDGIGRLGAGRLGNRVASHACCGVTRPGSPWWGR